MVSPVEKIYGIYVQQRMDQLIKPKSLDLWGIYKESPFTLKENSLKLRLHRIRDGYYGFLIYAKHPQCFLSGWGKKWAMEQDRILGVAYRLPCVAFSENLLQKRAWQQLVNAACVCTDVTHTRYIVDVAGRLYSFSGGMRCV